MQDFSADEEGARSVAQAESHHLDEGEDDCEDVQLGDEDLDEGHQQQRDYNHSLALHHEGSPAVLLQELAREESHDHLQQVQVDEDLQYALLVLAGNRQEGHASSEVAKRSASGQLVEEDNPARHEQSSLVGLSNRVEESRLFRLNINLRQSFRLLELLDTDLLVHHGHVSLQRLVLLILDHALHCFIATLCEAYGYTFCEVCNLMSAGMMGSPVIMRQPISLDASPTTM